MDPKPFSPVKGQQWQWSRSALWPAVTSMLLLSGLASGAAEGGASFQQRFGGANPNREAADALHIKRISAGPEDINGVVSEAAADRVSARRKRAVLSSISAFSFDPAAVRSPANPGSFPHAAADRSPQSPRPDLLSGIPQDYATLAVTLAAKERVDPNWVLSIMRAENARFDPALVSPAGAVGLMQVMPKVGEAFGARDLTDPEDNIRAGTRFLRVLIDKYRNPVLIAAAYNAGEPHVDTNRSLPLIRETADYVTRVIGYFTGAMATAPVRQDSSATRPRSKSTRRLGRAERAKSPMVVFAIEDRSGRGDRVPHQEQPNRLDRPVKIVREEVLQ